MTPMTDPAFAVLPYGGRLGRKLSLLPLDNLHWPLGRPDRLAQGVVGDLTGADHLIVYPKTAMHVQPSWGTRARVSIMVVEPAIIHARHLRMLRWTYRRFFRVLAYNEALLAAIPNGLLLPFGTTWVPEYADLDLSKSRHMSLIASAKRDHEGHKLRHEMVNHVTRSGLDVAVLGRGYAPFAVKADGLAPYRFSVVIENVQEPNYFSEKLVDAVLCDTVPIYWGCPNVGEFIDPGGMVICHSVEDLKAAITAASTVQYEALLPALRAAKPQAAGWANLEKRAALAVRASL